MSLNTSRAAAAALAVLAAPLTLLPTDATASDDQAFPTRIFSAESPFYQRLPDDTPTADDSDAVVARLVQDSHEAYGTPDRRNVDISMSRWAPTMYVAHNSDPVPPLRTWDCQNKGWDGWDRDLVDDHFKNVHIPATAVPDNSTDGSMVLYNPDDDTVTETWVTSKKPDGSWSACWGGTIRDASKALGQHRSYYGVSGSGLSMAGFVIRPEELQKGHIDHVIALNVPSVERGPSWPAVRSDGNLESAAPKEGQILRLPANVDIDSMRLSPVARTIAEAAQEYGVMVTDRGGAVTFIAQNADGMKHDPYDDIFRGRWASQEMAGDPDRGEQAFPLDKLVALPADYHVKGNANPAPAPQPSPAPSPFEIRQSASTTGPVQDSTGHRWAARLPGTLDTRNMTTTPDWQPITGTDVPEVYRATAWGVKHYGTNVPDGTYDVTLYMAEDYWNAQGRRVFDVLAEGRKVLDDVDVWAWTGGRYRALERTVTVQVDDGHLDLDWDASVDLGLVNGIKITRH